jgi:hypothetical protein
MHDSKNHIREGKLEKLFGISMLLAFLIAIVSAFVTIPNVAAILLVLGGIGAVRSADNPDLRLRVYAAGIILILGAQALDAIPVVGVALANIFSAFATVFIGASVVCITLAIIQLLRANLLKPAKA